MRYSEIVDNPGEAAESSTNSALLGEFLNSNVGTLRATEAINPLEGAISSNLPVVEIKSLPSGLKIGGYLDLRGTGIKPLPSDLKIGPDLKLPRS
jgi:hypothetical protein